MSNPVFVKATGIVASIGPSITPTTVGDSLLIGIELTGTGSVTDVTSNISGETPVQDYATTNFAIWRVVAASTASHTFSYTTSGTPNLLSNAIEVSNLPPFNAGATQNSGSSASPVSNPLTPPSNEAFLVAQILANGSETLGTWINGFTQAGQFTGGPTVGMAYLVQATAASVTGGVGLSGSNSWNAGLVSYANAAPSVAPPIYYRRKRLFFY